MRKMPALALFSLLLGSVTTLFGTSTTSLNCAAGQNLQYYMDSYGGLNACTIGVLSYRNFSMISSLSLGTPQLSALDIGITLAPDGLGFDFSFPTRLYNGDKYLISYQVDPAPILAGESLKLGAIDEGTVIVEPTSGFAVAPTNILVSVTASKWACADTLFSNTPPSTNVGTVGAIQTAFTCLGRDPLPYFIQVGPGQSATTTYANPASFAEVRVLFELSGQVPPISTVTTSVLTIPEPGSMAMLGGGIVAMLAALRRRKA